MTASGADSGSGSGSAPTTAAGQGAGGTSACTLGELSLSLGTPFPNGASGSLARPLVLKNSSAAACTVLGWPGVAALDGGGNQIYQASRAGSAGSTITLQPGGTAAAVLYAVTSYAAAGGSGPSCGSTPNLLVTPPNETHSAQVPFQTTLCVPPALTALSAGSSGGGSAQAAAEFSEAQQLWKAGASAISANQGYYWREAAALLTNAADSGAPGSSGFSTQAGHLTQLAGLPDAMETAAQQAEAHSDTNALNTFFNTPGLYS